MKWSIVRKAQIIGTLAGALVTVGFIIIYLTILPKGDIGAAMFIMWLAWPAVLVCELFGWMSLLQADAGMNLVLSWCLMIIINSFIGFLVGSIIGFIQKSVK
jgi:hypothetical protein